MIMRLGETYLLKAEAHVEQGELVGAAEAINVLRERADAPLVAAEQLDLDLILDERTRELIGEENRGLELMRTGTLVERATRINNDAPEGMRIEELTEINELLPIPLREIQLNKDGKLEQKAGY